MQSKIKSSQVKQSHDSPGGLAECKSVFGQDSEPPTAPNWQVVSTICARMGECKYVTHYAELK